MSTNTKQLITSIDELTCAIEQDFYNYADIFDQIIGHVVKNSQHISAFISYLNLQLSNASTRRKGLILLSAFIQLCPVEIAADHATAWINNCMKYCEGERQIDAISYKIIKPLLELCSKTPEHTKVVVSSILEKIIDEIKLLDVHSEHCNAALDCLLTCIRVYPGACGSRKVPLEKYLTVYMTSSLPPALVRKAGKCFNSLQQVGGGGTEGVNYSANWLKAQQCLVATLHASMDQFFETVTEFGDYEEDIQGISPLEFPAFTEGKHFKEIAQRIMNTTIFLEEMLLGSFPVPKSVLPEIILNLISRGLAVTTSTLGAHVVEDSINLSAYLCLIHKHLLQLLQCLIVSLDMDLMPFGLTVCKLIFNSLKNTSGEDMYSVQAICNLHLTTYETLRLWLNTVKAASSLDAVIDVLFPILINDVIPMKIELNLTVQNGSSKNLSKKARKKLIEQKTESFAARKSMMFSNKFLTESNLHSDICASALQTMQIIVLYEGQYIKPIYHKEMQEHVIKTLFSIQNGTISYPYNNEHCQIELYKTLIRLTTNHHYGIPPPVEFAMYLLKNGQANNNFLISEICSNGLANLNSFINPPCPSLDIPIDWNELKAELNIKEKEKEIFIDMDVDDIEKSNENEEESNVNEEESNENEAESIQEEEMIKEKNSEEAVIKMEVECPDIQSKDMENKNSTIEKNIPTDEERNEEKQNNVKEKEAEAQLDMNKEDDVISVVSDDLEIDEQQSNDEVSVSKELESSESSKIIEIPEETTIKTIDSSEVIEISEDVEKEEKQQEIVKESVLVSESTKEGSEKDTTTEEKSKITEEKSKTTEETELDEDDICSTFVDILNDD